MTYIVDGLTGLISLAKNNLKGIKSLALLIGGFPSDLSKLDKFLKTIKQHKDGLVFTDSAHGMASKLSAIAASQIKDPKE